MSEKAIRNKTTDRGFGLTFFILLIGLTLFLFYRNGQVHWALTSAAAAFFLSAMLFPRILSPLNNAWFKFGIILSKVTNPVILGLMFYVVFTPIGFIIRTLGKDTITKSPSLARETYWTDKSGDDKTDFRELF